MIDKLKTKIYNLLRWSEKYFKTDMIYLARGGFWLTLGQVISSLSSFLLAIAFANLLPKETYGNYRYILSLVGILGIFSLTGMGTATTQAVARGFEGSFYSGFKEKLKFGILGSIAALGSAIYYFSKGNYTLPIPLLISAIFLPLWQASGIYGNFLNGKKLFNYLVSWGTISQLISIFSLIITLFLTKNLFRLIAVYFISGTFSTYFFYLLTQKKFQPNKKEDPETLSYGKHLSLIDIFSQIAFYLDRILIFHYLGTAEVAIYSFAITPPEQIKGLLKNIQPLALPKFAEKDGKEIKKTVFKKMVKLFFFLLPVVILYILIAPILYRILFPKYLTSVFYSQIFSISILSQSIFFLGIIILQSQKAQRQLYQLNIFTSIIQIILLFFGVYFYGIFGAILARVISRFIGTGLSLWSIRKT
jgi:O-antigen/teichoic acid export membrane protein